MVKEQGLLGAPMCMSSPGALLNTRALGVILCACALVSGGVLAATCPGLLHVWGRAEEGTCPGRLWESVSVPHVCERRPNVMTVWE